MTRTRNTIVAFACLALAASAFDSAQARGSGHSGTTSKNVTLDTITPVPMHQAATPHSVPNYPVPTFTSVAGAPH